MSSVPTEPYDDVVIGSGEGGKYLAWHLASQGRRTAVIERRWIGGSCPNINCLPSKNEIWSARVAHIARRAADYGIQTGPVSVDMKQVVARKRQMVEDLVAFHKDKYETSGAELIMGTGRLVGPKTIEVELQDGGTRMLSASRLFLNVGTHPTLPDIPGLRDASPMTNIELLELDHQPDHLIILGGGYVGLELAQAFRRFGSSVTVIDQNKRLLPREDPDIADAVRQVLESESMEFILDADTNTIQGKSGDQIIAHITTPAGPRTIRGTHLLVAAGRTPNTAGIGLEEHGIQLTDRGYIKVDERLRATAPDTWALGECAGTPQFTHISLDDFRVIRDTLAGKDRTTTNRQVPYCMFIDPPLARIGLSETDATARGLRFRIARLPMKGVLKTRTTLENAGLMKAIIAPNDQIIGFTMLGSEAGEVMSTVQTAMLGNLPYTTLQNAILAHPTITEGLNNLFGNVE